MEKWIKNATHLEDNLVKNLTLLADYCNVTRDSSLPNATHQLPLDGSPGSDMLLVYHNYLEFESIAAALHPMMPDRRVSGWPPLVLACLLAVALPERPTPANAELTTCSFAFQQLCHLQHRQ
jgi:hypothetical protein